MTTTTATTFPRTQHWGVDGFRVSILLYKSHRQQRCYVCGERGAIHWVSADRAADGASGMGDFCTECRPIKGTLPPLVYIRWYHTGPFYTCESLNPHPEWTCACGQPARFWERLICNDCDEPEFRVFYSNRVITLHGERTDSGFRHEQHDVLETYECNACRAAARWTTG